MTKRNSRTVRSFADSARERAFEWAASEHAGIVSDDAFRSSDKMAGYVVKMSSKGSGSSRAQMERIAMRALRDADAVIDRREYAPEAQSNQPKAEVT